MFKKIKLKTISDVRGFLRVLRVFLPLPIFWALYEQQGSRWTDQAIQLDGRIGSFVIKPDQMQAVNPILIIILIPIFDLIVYPLFAKINIFKRLLQRMFIGLCLAALSFLISALLEFKMQQALIAQNPPNNIRVLNLLPCNLTILNQKESEQQLKFEELSYLSNTVVNVATAFRNVISNEKAIQIKIKYSCKTGWNLDEELYNITSNDKSKTLVFYMDNNQTKIIELPYNNHDSKVGFSQIMFRSLNTESFGSLNPMLSETGISINDFEVFF